MIDKHIGDNIIWTKCWLDVIWETSLKTVTEV